VFVLGRHFDSAGAQEKYSPHCCQGCPGGILAGSWIAISTPASGASRLNRCVVGGGGLHASQLPSFPLPTYFKVTI
jgi:hypothetical protein